MADVRWPALRRWSMLYRGSPRVDEALDLLRENDYDALLAMTEGASPVVVQPFDASRVISMLSVSGQEGAPEKQTESSGVEMQKTSMLATSATETESVASDEMMGFGGGGATGLFTQSDPASRRVVPENVGGRTVFKVTRFTHFRIKNCESSSFGSG